MPNPSRQPPFALLLALAWALIAAQLLVQHWGHTALTLNDTDDAMRLVEMRAYLAGQGWFDLHQGRVQPPVGLDSHWSRLIDAGLAGLFGLFHQFADAAIAERLMRAVWPLLWLFPALVATTAIAWRIAGRAGALAALLLATLGLPAFSQFHPGRIDHHNVQIALALLTVAATAWSDRVRWAAGAAGVSTALAVAVGFEGLPFAVLCGAVFALRFGGDAAAARALRDYGLVMAASLIGALAISVAPAHWRQSACDMIAFNSVLPAAAGGLLLAAAARFGGASTVMRWTLVAGAGAVSLGLFAWADPRCLAGPFARIDGNIWPIWLAHVNEMQPLAHLMRSDPLSAGWLAIFPALALVATVALACDRALRRDAGFLTAAAALLLAIATTLATIKGAPYAIWFGIPLMAAFAVHLFALLRLESLLARFAVVMLLTPTAAGSAVVAVAVASGHDGAGEGARLAREACFASASYAALAELPPGLVAANVDYGPFVLALTPHSALAAPYHRLSGGILAAHAVFAATPPEARAILARLHATYVVTCGTREPPGLDPGERAASLWAHLQVGDVPGWLEPVARTAGERLHIYRIRPLLTAAHGQDSGGGAVPGRYRQ